MIIISEFFRGRSKGAVRASLDNYSPMPHLPFANTRQWCEAPIMSSIEYNTEYTVVCTIWMFSLFTLLL